MTRAAVALSLVALAGLCSCDTVFGLERGPDAARTPVVVSGRITQKYLHGDTGGELVAEAVPLVQADAPVVRVGGAPADIGWTASEGIFTFTAREGEPYQLLYAGTEYQLAAPTVMIDRVIPGRPDAAAPQPGTVLHISAAPALPIGANVYVISTGIFSVTKPNTVTATEFTLNWSNALFYGTPSLLDAARHDAAYLVTFAVDPAGYEVMDSYVPVSVTLVQGQMTTVAGQLAAVARGHCVTADPAALGGELARVQAAVPGLPDGAISWRLLHAARPELGVPVAYALAGAAVFASTAVDVHYGLPFPSFAPVMTYTAEAGSSSGALAESVSVTYLQPIEARATCGAPPVSIGAPIPTNPRLAGVAIAEDVTIGVPAAGDAVLTWEEAPGSLPSTSYRVSVFEVTGETTTLVRDIRTAAPRAVIASDLLADGGRYRLEIVAGNELPDFASGQVTKQNAAYGAGILRTAVFEVSR